jgi:alpha-L-rhamnosidase
MSLRNHFRKARWIWDASDRLSRHYYLAARQTFSITRSSLTALIKADGAFMAITADAYYQVWVNGNMLGHGPAKSPEEECFVDRYQVAALLREGENSIEVLAQNIGYGTMNYCLGEAGLIFELRLPGRIVASGTGTLVRREKRYRRDTVRRWIMPGIENFDAAAGEDSWRKAVVVEKTEKLLPRPVGLPNREPITPQQVISKDLVRLPNFYTSFRVKPYLVSREQSLRHNIFQTPAFIVADLISPQAQELALVPTSGSVTWYFHGKKLVTGTGWGLWGEAGAQKMLKLKKGANRLIGILGHNHFEEIHLAGFVFSSIRLKNPFGRGGFQIIPAGEEPIEQTEKLPALYERLVGRGTFPKMNPADTLAEANFQDLAVNARPVKADAPQVSVIDGGWKLPATNSGEAVRVIVDLGAVRNGWIAVRASGRKGSRLILSMFEAVEAPLCINWPEAVNNAISYRLKDGEQSFESFFAYGCRYIAVHHEGGHPTELRDLRLLTSNCGGPRQGAFHSDDLMLNSIYSICEQTVHSATDDSLTDCPTYEAVNWNFDNRLGAITDLVTFRNLDILRNTIEVYARDPRYPALVRSHYPSAWDNRIPVFCFHWIIFCREFYQATGDLAFVRRIFLQVARGLKEALGMIDDSGLMRWPQAEKPWHIIDWHPARDDNHPCVSAEQAILIGALEAGAALAKLLPGASMKSHARRWLQAAAKLRLAVHRHFWVAKRDAYADSIHEDGTLSKVSSQPSNAALASYGVGSAAWRKRLALRIGRGGDGLLTFGSAMGLFYVMEFLDQTSEMETIFRIIRKDWSPMVLAGDSTTWEHFAEWGQARFPTRSRCHPFASYILKYFAKYLLGLEPVGVGTRKFRFKVQPPSGITSCEGIIPTELGGIRVKWSKTKACLVTHVEAPTGIVIKKD